MKMAADREEEIVKKFINFINNVGDILTESLRAFASAIVKLNTDSVYVTLLMRRFIVQLH